METYFISFKVQLNNITIIKNNPLTKQENEKYDINHKKIYLLIF